MQEATRKLKMTSSVTREEKPGFKASSNWYNCWEISDRSSGITQGNKLAKPAEAI